MSYLRTNTRLKGKDLDANAIGGGVRNWLEGSMGSPLVDGRGNKFYGGTVIFSIAENQSGIISITADSILAQFYGVTMASNTLTSGYKVALQNIMIASEQSILLVYAPIYSFSAGNSNTLIAARKTSLSAGPSEVIMTVLGTSFSQHIICVGLIISTPFGRQ